MNEKVRSLVEAARVLSNDEMKSFINSLADVVPEKVSQPTIINYLVVQRKKIAKRNAATTPSSSQASAGASLGSEVEGIQPSRPAKSAWKTPFIFRGDRIPENGVLFIDVEKVSLKKPPGTKKHEQVAATIAIVDLDGELVFWCFVKWNVGKEEVCQYFPSLTKLNRDTLHKGIPLMDVHKMLDMITPSNMIIGLNVENDFKSMRYADRGVKLDELQDFYKDSSGPFRLKDLAKELLQKVDFQESDHSCISDARATKDLYKLREKMRFRNDFSPLQKMKRGPKPTFKLDRNDRCDCGRQ